MKVACTVLRGLGAGNRVWLPDQGNGHGGFITRGGIIAMSVRPEQGGNHYHVSATDGRIWLDARWVKIVIVRVVV